MRKLLPLAVLLVSFWGGAATVGVDVPFGLGLSAGDASLFGVGLAHPDSLANPAALGFREGFEAVSTYASPFGAGQVWALALSGPHVSASGQVFDSGPIGPSLSYRVEAFSLSGAARLRSLSLGARLRVLHPLRPKEAWGWSWDVGALWQGPIYLGALAEAVVARAPLSEEDWPRDFSLALMLPFPIFGFPAFFGLAGEDLLTLPSWSAAGGIRIDSLSLRLALSSSGLSLGGDLAWGMFDLGWAWLLHPHLPQNFRVSLSLKWP